MKDNQEIAKDYTDWMVKTGGYARDMTLRDYFAAEAMKEIIHECFDFEETAERAYQIADAMLKERAK